MLFFTVYLMFKPFATISWSRELVSSINPFPALPRRWWMTCWSRASDPLWLLCNSKLGHSEDTGATNTFMTWMLFMLSAAAVLLWAFSTQFSRMPLSCNLQNLEQRFRCIFPKEHLYLIQGVFNCNDKGFGRFHAPVTFLTFLLCYWFFLYFNSG